MASFSGLRRVNRARQSGSPGAVCGVFLEAPLFWNPSCQQHMGRLTYGEQGRGFGILRRRRRVLGAPGGRAGDAGLCQALHSLQPGPASQQGRPGLRKRLTSTNSHHLCRVGKPHVLPRLLFMRRAGWLFSVVQSVGTRWVPSRLPLGDGKGRAPRRVRGRQRKAAIGGPPGSKPGEASAGGRRGVGREVGVGVGGGWRGVRRE